ncbi:MAG: hypothetical protein U0637_06465 [Phycisphaerales bacterium]
MTNPQPPRTVDHTWFRLLVRATGVALIGMSVPTIFSSISTFAWAVMDQSQYAGQGTWYVAMYGASLLGALLQFLIGAYLTFFGEGFIRRCLLDVRDRCPTCHYDTRGITTTSCPECGEPITPRQTTTQPPAHP